MKSVAIRDLSGDLISAATEIMGVTNRGSLVGVILPLTQANLRRLAGGDAPERAKRARLAEAEMASGAPMTTLSELLTEPATSNMPADLHRVSIRELSGARLEKAAREQETLLLTSGRLTKALFIAITPAWTERLIESGINHFIDGDTSAPQARATGATSAPAAAQAAASQPTAEAPALSGLGTWAHPGSPHLGDHFLRQRAIGIRIIADAPGDCQRLEGIVTDMLAQPKGEPVKREVENIDEAVFVAGIISLVQELASQLTGDQQLMGVGVEVGGHIYKGRVVFSPNADWRQFPLEEQLRTALGGLPVAVDNDANALATYERLFEGVADDNFAVILLTNVGIGCGLVVNGRVFRGARGMAGELGHIAFADLKPLPEGITYIAREQEADDDILCRCGKHSCVEQVAAPAAIERALLKVGFKGDYEMAVQTHRDAAVRWALERAGSAFGLAASAVINVLNPSAIVFYGPRELLGESREFHVEDHPRVRVTDDPRVRGSARHYTDAMVSAILEHTFSTGASVCQFITRTAVDKYSARAAAACLINRISRLPAVAAAPSGRSEFVRDDAVLAAMRDS
jgi:predicted NBD/HSP70 family sugar kinase